MSTSTHSAETLANAAGISIVDFTGFRDGTNKQSVAAEILTSFRRSGIVYLVNHGLSVEKVANMFAMSKAFFALPDREKQLAPHPASGTHHRGYSTPGQEKIVRVTETGDVVPHDVAPDMKEHFDCGVEGDETQPNVWLPDGILPGFNESCMEFYQRCHTVELNILSSVALAMRLPEDYFSARHGAKNNHLRLLHYPSVCAQALKNKTVNRIFSHSDFGTITLLFQDNAGGLEIEDPTQLGVYYPVPPIPGAVIVNAGDLLKRWSNDTIHSPVHRVSAPPNADAAGMVSERYSIPYFCIPDFDAPIDCAPGTWDADRPKKYEPTTAGEYVTKRLAAAY